ncbi:hypothetical protein ElyMa_003730500 [Elysia marginata]|uniref:Uncharacterized protein n=1 Tax=Elysia marginata TaxID=1093978 RepID=A0AAV4F5X4_9GAST|nr:hypothetical protein ElyMa_003730500 [Elysia marginata]
MVTITTAAAAIATRTTTITTTAMTSIITATTEAKITTTAIIITPTRIVSTAITPIYSIAKPRTITYCIPSRLHPPHSLDGCHTGGTGRCRSRHSTGTAHRCTVLEWVSAQRW